MGIADRYSNWLSARVADAGLQHSWPLRAAAYGLPAIAMEKLLQRWPELNLMPELNLFEADDLLGWKLRRCADSLYSTYDVRARYTTDESGRRVVPSTSSGPPLYLMGCSVTFGFCVNDDQTFAAQLGKEFQVENYAVPGYGTGHQHLLMTRGGLLERAARTGATLVYAWYPTHTLRVWRRRSWLKAMELSVGAGAYQGNPLFDIEEGQLCHRGLIRAKDAVSDEHPVVARMEWRVTNDLLADMASAAKRAGVPFVVAVMPHLDGLARRFLTLSNRMTERLDQLGIPALKLARPDGREPDLRHPFMPYPTPEGHRLLAQRLLHGLRERASKPAKSSSSPSCLMVEFEH